MNKITGDKPSIKVEECTVDQFVIFNNINRRKILVCCDRRSEYIVILRCGPNPDEAYVICGKHMRDPDYYRYVKTACAIS